MMHMGGDCHAAKLRRNPEPAKNSVIGPASGNCLWQKAVTFPKALRMNRKLTALLVFICFFTISRAQQAQWKLVWSDEFNYTGLPDSTKWDYNVGGHGWGNNELQYYTKARAANAWVAKGKLTITAVKEPFEGKAYTSARLVTRGKAEWQYGRIDVRARIPEGLGTWPAIWMLGATEPLKWPDDGEIDIMEHVGFDPGRFHFSVHTKKYNHVIGTQKTTQTMIPDFRKNYHTYSVIWDAQQVKLLVDGKEYFSFSNEHSGYEAWPFDNKMYLILNIAVGGNWGGQKGVDEKIWPKKMEVDWVRVYELTTKY